jgi:hypothetical protein
MSENFKYVWLAFRSNVSDGIFEREMFAVDQPMQNGAAAAASGMLLALCVVAPEEYQGWFRYQRRPN